MRAVADSVRPPEELHDGLEDDLDCGGKVLLGEHLAQNCAVAVAAGKREVGLEVEHEPDVRILDVRLLIRRRIRLEPLAVRLLRLRDAVELEAGQTRLVGAPDNAQDELDLVLLCGKDAVSSATCLKLVSKDAPAYRLMIAFFSRDSWAKALSFSTMTALPMRTCSRSMTFARLAGSSSSVIARILHDSVSDWARCDDVHERTFEADSSRRNAAR